MGTVYSIDASKLQQRKTYVHNFIPWFNMKLLFLNIIIIVLNGICGRPQNLDDGVPDESVNYDYDIDLKCFEYRSEGYRYVEQRLRLFYWNK